MSGPFDYQDARERQQVDATPTPPTVDEDWTSLPLLLEDSPGGRSPEEIVAALGAVPAELDRLLAGVSPDAMKQPAHDGEAAVVELVAHLRDWDAVVGDWVSLILEDGESPTLEVPDDSLWAIEHDYPAQDPLAALAGFRDQRTDLVDFLTRLSDDEWERTGNLEGTGNQTVREILDGLCRRDAEHLDRIREALT